MWIAKLKIRHDCVIGNRCRKFHATTLGTPFNVFVEKGITFAPQIQTIQGTESDVRGFIKDLKSEKRIKNLEVEGNTVFFIEVRKDRIPSSFYNPYLLFVKPVFVDKQGFEHWEIASWKKHFISKFISLLSREVPELELQKFSQTRLLDIYFARLSPKLTPKQKLALQLALEQGFYAWPKKTDFGRLAKAMKISVSTYREHLKRAESKLLPDLAKSIE